MRHRLRARNRRVGFALRQTALVLLLTATGSVFAEPCGTAYTFMGPIGSTTMLQNSNFTTVAPPAGVPATCSMAGMSFRTVVGTVMCNAYAGANFIQLQVTFPSSAANNSMNGCTWSCDGGVICKVQGGDNLPVELLDLDVE